MQKTQRKKSCKENDEKSTKLSGVVLEKARILGEE